MRVRAKDYARTLLDLVEADHAARDYRAALDSTAVTIRELRAELDNVRGSQNARLGLALSWIGTACRDNTQGRCWQGNKTPRGEFLAERWCVGCQTAWGLGVDNPPELITT